MSDERKIVTTEDVLSLASAIFDTAWDLSGEGHNGEYIRDSALERFRASRRKAINAEIERWWRENGRP